MKNNKTLLKNGLYIVATPIGNLQDISFRAIKILEKSNFIICENPTHSLKLLREYKIKKKLISIHDYNELSVIKKISNHLKDSIVSLISDAGSPLISDPGYKLVKYCIDENIFITSIPGPSSLISALQNSGITINTFDFNGFVPKKDNQINQLFEKTKEFQGAQIFFTSSHRLIKNLEFISKFFINRKIAICKELTKINEMVIRTTTNQILEKIKNENIKIKGEFIIIIEGKNDKNANIINKKIINNLIVISKKFSLTDSVKIVHGLTDLPKKELYKIALTKIKNKNV